MTSLGPPVHTSFLSSLALLSCSLSFFSVSVSTMEVSEAEQIALESSPGDLIASASLVERIAKDLKAIRAKYPEVANNTHTGKWQPGKLMVNLEDGMKKEQLDAINTSPYGPSVAASIFQDKIFLITFSKPYNPVKLGEVLDKELGIRGARPDGVIGGSSSIALTSGPGGKNTYVFFEGSGDCFAGCINKTYRTYSVGPDEQVEKLEERIDDPTQGGETDGPVGMFGIH